MSRQVTAGVTTPQPTSKTARLLQRKCACGTHAASEMCEDCSRKRQELRRKTSGDEAPRGVPQVVHDVLGSGGQPLDAAARADMEPRFGRDFSRVRIHTDPRAADSARAVSALAYTLGDHIVFGRSQYAPGTGAGRQLLAHELTHVVQQGGTAGDAMLKPEVGPADGPHEREADRIAASIGSAIAPRISAAAPRLMRRWDPPERGDCPANPDGRWLQRVVVDQEKAQSVTLYWSDSTIESSICSTGKGQCCTDTPEGVNSSVAESKRSGTNCTPITEGAGLPITDRIRDNGWKFWNTFHAARAIALHQHHTVTGTPLSHGCVRLPLETARTIFCGERQNKTMVEVRGFARPDCDEPELQKEWQSDFQSAARVTDGEPPNIQEIIRRNRRGSRAFLRSAYDRDLSEIEIQEGAAGRMRIPRCATERALPSTEEGRALPATGAGANVPTDAIEILNSSGFSEVGAALARDLAGARNQAAARRVVRAHGRQLWTRATARAAGTSGNSDDRPLYWARLMLTRTLRQWDPRFTLAAPDRESLMQDLERASRGMDTITYGRNENEKRILISGFDPFGLEAPVYGQTRASNPSGAAALALDGKQVKSGALRGIVQSVVFPVRYADFDQGIVATVFQPFLTGPDAVDMIMTISMGGRGDDFEVEEFAGRSRQPSMDDNAGVAQGQASSPAGPGPEFLRTTLPASARGSLGRTQPNEQESEVREIPRGKQQPVRRRSGPTAGSTAVEGSGGGFLSNEIFYRASLLRRQSGSSVPVGHLHTPFLDQAQGQAAFEQQRKKIVTAVEQIISATLPDL